MSQGTMWVDAVNDKLYTMFQFSATIIDSFSVSAVDGVPSGVCDDPNADIIMSGNTNDKLYKFSAHTSTVKDSFSISAVSSSCDGTSTIDDDYFISVAGATAKLFRFSTFTSTVKDSINITTQDTIPTGVTHTGNSNEVDKVLFTGVANAKFFKLSSFTTTVNDSFSLGATYTSAVGASWDGTDAMVIYSASQIIIKYSTFTSTIKDSADVSATANSPNGLGYSPHYERVGNYNIGTILKPTFIKGYRVSHKAVSLTEQRMIDFNKRYHQGRGGFRIANEAQYEFLRSQSGPPAEDAAAFETSTTMPYTTTATFADGTWYIAMRYRNKYGIPSGLFPVGPNGELYHLLNVSGGAAQENPPNAPNQWNLAAGQNGLIIINGFYWQNDSLKGTELAIAFTTNGVDPVADSPDFTIVIPATGIYKFSLQDTSDIPLQADGTTVRVIVQTRRAKAGGGYVYSTNTTDIKTITADALGPAAPPQVQTYRGNI